MKVVSGNSKTTSKMFEIVSGLGKFTSEFEKTGGKNWVILSSYKINGNKFQVKNECL